MRHAMRIGRRRVAHPTCGAAREPAPVQPARGGGGRVGTCAGYVRVWRERGGEAAEGVRRRRRAGPRAQCRLTRADVHVRVGACVTRVSCAWPAPFAFCSGVHVLLCSSLRMAIAIESHSARVRVLRVYLYKT